LTDLKKLIFEYLATEIDESEKEELLLLKQFLILLRSLVSHGYFIEPENQRYIQEKLVTLLNPQKGVDEDVISISKM
jgi:hypothetical protein